MTAARETPDEQSPKGAPLGAESYYNSNMTNTNTIKVGDTVHGHEELCYDREVDRIAYVGTVTAINAANTATIVVRQSAFDVLNGDTVFESVSRLTAI